MKLLTRTSLLSFRTLLVFSFVLFGTTSYSTATFRGNLAVVDLPLASQWIISRYVVGTKVSYPEIKNAYITINSTLSSFMGAGGCNSLRGSVYVSGKSLRFDSIVSTKMACSELASETLFISNLQKVKEYKIVGGELFLYNKDHKLIMVLESFR
ncbi:MAG: META domain-containing protein [Flectobacillus sp.]|nr:META domain-containing protein [Flectobacillus sp.]